MAFYVETEFLNHVAEAIAQVEPCPFAGRVTPDQIKIVLGEVADVWPASIVNDNKNSLSAS